MCLQCDSGVFELQTIHNRLTVVLPIITQDIQIGLLHKTFSFYPHVAVHKAAKYAAQVPTFVTETLARLDRG